MRFFRRNHENRRPPPWLVGLLALALLYQAAFFVFAFASSADADDEFHLPFCTGAGIIWIKVGDVPGAAALTPLDEEADRADYPMCPLCGPAIAPMPVPPVFAAGPVGAGSDVLIPSDLHPGRGAVKSAPARAPPLTI